jgi:hypothetical protein
MPFIFSTTLLLYKLDTLLLKQKNLSVLDITGFFFRIRIQVTALVLRTSAFTRVFIHAEKETGYIQYGPLLLFQQYCISYMSEIVDPLKVEQKSYIH